MSRARRAEAGSAALEAAVGLPAFMLFVALVILGGRLAIATQAVQASAAEAARVASIARTQGDAARTATDGCEVLPGQPAPALHRRDRHRRHHRVRRYRSAPPPRSPRR